MYSSGVLDFIYKMIFIFIFDGVTKTTKQSVFFARAAKQKVWSEAENKERDTGVVRLARLARVRLLKANVGKYRESQISSKNSNFHPNIPLGELFQEMILRNPQALYILRILDKFENSQKIHFFIRETGANFNRFQRNSTGAQKLLLT